MEDDTQRALQMFYELRKDLIKSEDAVKLKQLNQLISLLESSFFNKIVVLHKSLDALKRQKNLTPSDIHFDETTGVISAEGNEVILPNDAKLLPLSKNDFDIRVKALVGDRELLHIQINKTSASQTLGFSISSAGTLHSSGIFVGDVTQGSLAEKSGVKAHYQIVAIDGVPLDSPDSNKDIAVEALKSSHMRIDLYLARDKYSHQVSPAKDISHTRNRSDMISTRELNTEWTQYEIIELRSIEGTFGFGIMGGLTCDVMVRTILSGGAAATDGRLCLNDHIMYINEKPVRHCSSNQVADYLKSAGDCVHLIVARPFDQSSGASGGRVQMVETTSLDSRLEMIVNRLYREDSSVRNDNGDNNSYVSFGDDEEDYAEFLVIDVPLSDSNLGITVVVCHKDDRSQSRGLDGVFVNDVPSESAAFTLGIRKYDRLLKINDISVESKRGSASIERLINSTNCARLHLQRYVSGPTYEELKASDLFSPRTTTMSSFDKKQSLEKMRTMKIHASSQSSDESNVTDVDDFDDEHYLKPLTTQDREDLINKWKRLLSGDCEIIIAEFSKFCEDGGLGISLEGTVDVDDSGLEVHPHHYVRTVVENGPAGRSGFLREKDELLEANDVCIFGVNHLDAVNILKNLPLSVRLVCARQAHLNTADYFYTPDDMSVEADKLCQDIDDIIAFETGSRSMYSIKSKSQDDLDEWPKDDSKMKDSTSRSRSLDQVHGLAIWDRQITYVDLEKRANGLGFSILDYQDPVNPQQSVIVIRSLVPNGAAAKDERIFPGDRLMSVNETDVSRATMAEAVDALKRTEPGTVRLGIVKALCLDPNNSQQVSFVHCDSIVDEELEDPLTEHDQQSPDSNIAAQYDNVSSPQLFDDFETDVNLEEFSYEPIPEALEHKLRVQKLSGQQLGLKLEGEGGFSHNENGFRVTAITSGSPAAKCGKLSVGDFVTKMDQSSLRNSTDEDVAALLRKVTSCDGDIKVSYIPEADYQIFVQSKTMQVNFSRAKQRCKEDDSDCDLIVPGFFPKPSAVKASGGKLVFIGAAEVVVVDSAVRIGGAVSSCTRSRSRISSLVDLYDTMGGDDKAVVSGRQEGVLPSWDICGR